MHSSGSDVRLWFPVGLWKKKTQKFAVPAGGGADNGGEKRNVLIVSLLLPIIIDLALRSKRQRRIEVLRMREQPVLLEHREVLSTWAKPSSVENLNEARRGKESQKQKKGWRMKHQTAKLT
jgi:hypothetical protein